MSCLLRLFASCAREWHFAVDQCTLNAKILIDEARSLLEKKHQQNKKRPLPRRRGSRPVVLLNSQVLKVSLAGDFDFGQADISSKRCASETKQRRQGRLSTNWMQAEGLVAATTTRVGVSATAAATTVVTTATTVAVVTTEQPTEQTTMTATAATTVVVATAVAVIMAASTTVAVAATIVMATPTGIVTATTTVTAKQAAAEQASFRRGTSGENQRAKQHGRNKNQTTHR